LLDSVQDPKALGSMIFVRIIYALNWMNVGAIFYLMSPDLHAGVSGLGTLTAAFYIGIGIVQVPAGVLAAKWGPKRVVVIGIFLCSLSAIGTSLVSTVLEISVLRFLVGAGMAFVFAPGIVIIAQLLRGGKSGMGVGLFNSAFDVGGLVALFGWVIVATYTGWRLSLALSGGIGVLTGILAAIFVPADEGSKEFTFSTNALLKIVKDRQLILIGLTMLGFDVGNTIISGFMILYLVSINVLSGIIAGLVTSLVTVVPIFTALWGGRVYDATTRHRTTVALTIIGSAAALAFASYPSVITGAACSALGGVVAGVGYTFAFAGARDRNDLGKEYDGLAIAWVNSIHLTGSFVPPVFFAGLVELLGYSQAWLWSAALTLVFLFPALMTMENWRR
jgi:MFS family permease